MTKKTNEKVDATQMSDEQLKKLHEKFRNDLREKFGKWLVVYDEESTTEDVNKAKAEFDEEVAKYANKIINIHDGKIVSIEQGENKNEETI